MFPPDLIDAILDKYRRPLPAGDKYEVEFRFLTPGPNGRMQNRVERRHFLQLLANLGKVPETAINTLPYDCITDYSRLVPLESEGSRRHPASIRYRRSVSVRRIPGAVEEPVPVTSVITKELVFRENKDNYNNDYGIKLAFSLERTQDAYPTKGPETVRTKKRYSFNFDGYRLDLSEVSDSSADCATMSMHSNTSFEVEVEILDIRRLKEFNNGELLRYWSKLWNSQLPWSFPERQSLIGQFNTALGDPRAPFLKVRNVPQPRNVHFKDLRYGGLVRDISKNPRNLWTVAYKADGVRQFLITNARGAYLVGLNGDVNKISDQRFSNHIIEGELIPTRQLKTPRADAPALSFWAYDYILANSPYDVRSQQLPRLQTELAGLTAISFYLKSYRVLNSVKEFFDKINNMLDLVDQAEFQTDGLIFTPMWPNYLDQRDDASVLKWKPPHQLTVDLALRRTTVDGREVIRALVTDTVEGKSALVPFGDFVIINNALIAGLPSGTVVECIWNPTLGGFEPQRLRPDKLYPNGRRVVDDLWHLIQHPITEATLRGQDFVLVRKFHNRIKQYLFDQVRQPEGILVDIGSGRGGDLRKMVSNFRQIVLIEPNVENRTELQRRLAELRPEDQAKFLVLGLKGEDTAAIQSAVLTFTHQQRVQVVSLMLSLSFFFRNTETLQALINTITSILAPDGQVVYLTIDGAAVGVLSDGVPLRLGPVTITPNLAAREVVFDWPGSITGTQLEWLVDLPTLASGLGSVLVPVEPLLEPFLTPDEQIYNGLYSYGLIRKSVEKNNLPDKDMILGTGVVPGTTIPLIEARAASSAPSPSTLGLTSLPGSIRLTPAAGASSAETAIGRLLEVRPGPGLTAPAASGLTGIGTLPRLASPLPSRVSPLATGLAPLPLSSLPQIPSSTAPLTNLPLGGLAPTSTPGLAPLSTGLAPLPLTTVGAASSATSLAPLPLTAVGGASSATSLAPLPTTTGLAPLPLGSLAPLPATTLSNLPLGGLAPLPLTTVGGASSATSLAPLPTGLAPLPLTTVGAAPLGTLPSSTTALGGLAPLSTTTLGTAMTLPRPSMGAFGPIVEMGTVTYGKERGQALGMLADDQIMPLPVAIPGVDSEVVRIGTIGDGHCFFHGLLKASSANYRNNKAMRTNIAASLRADLAAALEGPSKKFPGLTRYETIGKTSVDTPGMYVYNRLTLLADPSHAALTQTANMPTDWSLRSLQRLMNSDSYVGEEFFDYTALSLGIRLLMTIASTTGLEPATRQIYGLPTSPHIVVLSGDGTHYEVVAVREPTGLRVLYNDSHPLINYLLTFQPRRATTS